LELVRQVLLVVGIAHAETNRDGFQTAGNGILVNILGDISGVDYLSQAQQGLVLQFILLDDGLKGVLAFGLIVRQIPRSESSPN